MARTYANIDVGIWSDPDFCALSAGAQRTYFMLITQNDVTACGSLALTLRRWSKTCIDSDLAVWLAELSEARFVLVDEDTEELLVRTFVKWDGGHKHPTRVKAVIATARAIRSPLLKDAITSELARLGVSLATPEPPRKDTSATEQAPESYGSVVNEGDHQSTPHSSLREPGPTPSVPDVEPSPFCSEHINGTDKACARCGTARQRHARWQKREERRQLERRQAAERARTESVLHELRAAQAAAVPRPKEATA